MTEQKRRDELTEEILLDVRGLWKHHDEISILSTKDAAGIAQGACKHFVEWQKGIGKPFSVEDMMNASTVFLTMVRECLLEHEAGIAVKPVTRDSVTNNDIFGLRLLADDKGDKDLVECIDRYLQERGEEDFRRILNKIATQRYEVAKDKAAKAKAEKKESKQ